MNAPDPPLEVVLVAPEIAPNAGNVARLCAATGSRLHLVGPLGFSISSAQLKRAGLDYWDRVLARVWPDLDDFLQAMGARRLHLFTGRGGLGLWSARFTAGDLLVFGSESGGLPEALLEARPDRRVRIPMVQGHRSLNLATAAGIGVYEALRQTAAGR